jgi:hypothetical protein
MWWCAVEPSIWCKALPHVCVILRSCLQSCGKSVHRLSRKRVRLHQRPVFASSDTCWGNDWRRSPRGKSADRTAASTASRIMAMGHPGLSADLRAGREPGGIADLRAHRSFPLVCCRSPGCRSDGLAHRRRHKRLKRLLSITDVRAPSGVSARPRYD